MLTSDQIDVQDLNARIKGDVVTPGEDGWDASRGVFNLLLDQKPTAVVFAESALDVVEAMRFARANGLRVAPQSTGHNAGPLETLEDTLLVKTSRMREVEIDAEARRARVQAGARWEDVTARVSELGLAALHGSSPDVGVVGYSLGGGMGWFARKHGLQANSVTAIQIVTPDGRQRLVDADHEPDLFWALRGGGGNFGVVTAIEFALYPVDELYAGALFFPIERAAEVLHAWHELTPTLPEEITSVGRLLRFPPLPEIPEPLRGGAFAIVEAAYLGNGAEGAELLRPLRDLGPAIDTFAMVPPAALAELHMDPRHPVPSLTADRLVGDLPAAAIDDLLAVAGPGSGSTLLGFELRHLGGAMARSEPGHGARATLDGSFSLFAVGAVMDPASEAAIAADLERVTAAAAPWVVGRYANFAEQPIDTSTFYPDDVYRRLQAVKTLYDPDDLVRANHPVGRA